MDAYHRLWKLLVQTQSSSLLVPNPAYVLYNALLWLDCRDHSTMSHRPRNQSSNLFSFGCGHACKQARCNSEAAAEQWGLRWYLAMISMSIHTYLWGVTLHGWSSWLFWIQCWSASRFTCGNPGNKITWTKQCCYNSLHSSEFDRVAGVCSRPVTDVEY